MSSACRECGCSNSDSVPTREPRSTCRTGSCPTAWSTPARTTTTRPVGWFTSTHVATTQSWDEIVAERAFALRYLNTDGDEIHWDMIRLAFSSVADTAIIPLQDILGLDSRARMNMPGKAEGNWRWRFQKGQIDERAHDRLAELTAVYSRWNGAIPEGSRPAVSPRRTSTRLPGGPAIRRTASDPQTAP